MQLLDRSNFVEKYAISAAQIFYISLFISMLLKVYFYFQMPIFGDEAYYFNAGKLTALNLYDHPSMITVLTHWMDKLGGNAFVLRLPQFIMSTLLTLSPFILKEKTNDKDRVYLISSIFLLSPLNIVFVFLLNDACFLFFSVSVFLFLYLAFNHQRHYWYFLSLSAICLGAAFYSIYLALPVLLAAFFILFSEKKVSWAKKWGSVWVIFFAFLPFLSLNFYYNYEHNWSNILVAFSNERYFHQTGLEYFISVITPIMFILLIISPFNIIFCRDLRAWFYCNHPGCQLFRRAFLFELGFFSAMELSGASVALTWLFPAACLFILSLYFFYHPKKLTLFLVNMLMLELIISGFLIFIFNAPVLTLAKLPSHLAKDLVYVRSIPKLKRVMDSYRNEGYVAMANQYGPSGALSIDRPYMPTWRLNDTGYYGREDDVVYNFKTVSGKNVVIFGFSHFNTQDLLTVFSRVKERVVTIAGIKFYFVLAYDFNYPKYRDVYLRNTWHFFYAKKIKILPYGKNFFYQKYFTRQ